MISLIYILVYHNLRHEGIRFQIRIVYTYVPNPHPTLLFISIKIHAQIQTVIRRQLIIITSAQT